MYLFRISRESQYYNWYSKPLSVNYRIGLTKYSRKMIVDKCDVEIGGIACIKITRSQNERYEVSLFDINNPEYELKFVPRHLRFFKFIPYISLESQTEQILNAFCKKEEVSEEEKKRLKALTKNIYEISYLRGIDEEKYKVKDEVENRFLSVCQLLEFYYAVLIASRSKAVQDANNTYYIGPFRDNPSRVYRDAERQVDSVGARGEEVSTMLKSDFSHGKKVVTGVSSWFEKSMNYKLTLKDIGSGLYNIVVEKSDGVQDNLIDVGYGISQVLPIVAQLIKLKTQTRKRVYSLEENAKNMFIIEQPELHLHPGAQAELANLFVETVTRTEKGGPIEVLIETHSEHFIRRLQALIADKNIPITNDDVKIYYVDKNDENEAFIEEMKIMPNGQFEKEWPSGFFDKAHELSMELLKNNFK